MGEYIFKVHFYKSSLSTLNTYLYYILSFSRTNSADVSIFYTNMLLYYVLCRHVRRELLPEEKHIFHLGLSTCNIYFCITLQTYKKENIH